jgi:hypothetical protein
VSALSGIGVMGRVGALSHGGGPLSCPQLSSLPIRFNPVNHPISLGEITLNIRVRNLPEDRLNLDQAAPNGIADQACSLMSIKLFHEPCPVRFGSDCPRGAPEANKRVAN